MSWIPRFPERDQFGTKKRGGQPPFFSAHDKGPAGPDKKRVCPDWGQTLNALFQRRRRIDFAMPRHRLNLKLYLLTSPARKT